MPRALAFRPALAALLLPPERVRPTGALVNRPAHHALENARVPDAHDENSGQSAASQVHLRRRLESSPLPFP